MELKDYYQQDAISLANLIKKKEISPKDALACAHQRMMEVNPKLNAIIADRMDWGLMQLQKMTQKEPFYGVPILIKDLGFTMEGIPYSAGSHFYQSTKALVNSDLVKRLLELGFIPFAQTNIPELGLSYVTESKLWGPCHNPYDLTRTPGGSSGGSAAAVAAGIAPLATANDAGGSIRIPAACCGLFGFKPTPGLLSTGPYAAEAFSGLATAHVLTRTVRDSALLFDLLKAPTIREALSLKAPPKIGQKPKRISLIEGLFADVPVAKPYLLAVEKTTKILENLGYSMETHRVNLDLKGIGESALTLIYANLCAEIENQEERFGRRLKEGELEPINMEFLKRGKDIRASDLIRARNKIYQLTSPLHKLLEEVDILLTPSLAQLPLPIGGLPSSDTIPDFLRKNAEFSPFTSIFNQACLPAMMMPVMHHGKLPIAVQFATGKNRDHFLFDFAKVLEPYFPDFSKPIIDIN